MAATRRHYTEWEEGTRRRSVAADRRSWRQLDPRDGGFSESSLDNDETGQDCETARARQARRDGVSRSEPVVDPVKRVPPAQIWWIWAAQPCVPPHSAEEATLEPSSCGGAEALRLSTTGSFDMTKAPNAGGLFVGDYEGLTDSGAIFDPFFMMATPIASHGPTDPFASTAQ
jgi:hypothetical protein